MAEISSGWQLHLDESPEWLFFRIECAGPHADPNPPLAECMWRVAESKSIFRLVVEWPPHEPMRSFIVGQLILLHKRCNVAGGALRLCNISPNNYEVLEIMQLAPRFPNYRSREAAVMGYRD
jgi:hypothetical protein